MLGKGHGGLYKAQQVPNKEQSGRPRTKLAQCARRNFARPSSTRCFYSLLSTPDCYIRKINMLVLLAFLIFIFNCGGRQQLCNNTRARLGELFSIRVVEASHLNLAALGGAFSGHWQNYNEITSIFCYQIELPLKEIRILTHCD